MQIISVKDYQALSLQAARLIGAQVRLNPDTVLGLATGSTPVGTYKELIRMCAEEDLDFSNVTTVNLDEYYGLAPDHEQSYRYFMNQNLFDHINIDKEFTYVPDGLSKDLEASCADYDDLIEFLGGTDIQLLGIGHDGHIGFNEPDDVFTAGTHLVDLTPDTIEANARFFKSADEVPHQAITMGMKGIMSASTILILASGKAKASIIRKMVEGPVDPQVPASILQLHPDVVLIADEDALSELMAL